MTVVDAEGLVHAVRHENVSGSPHGVDYDQVYTHCLGLMRPIARFARHEPNLHVRAVSYTREGMPTCIDCIATLARR